MQHEPHFDGDTYEPGFDHDRLTGQYRRVFSVMRDRSWRTLREIEIALDEQYPQASISARLRDFRKSKFGGHVVLRRRRGIGRQGLHEYCLHENGCTCPECFRLEMGNAT